MGWFTRTPAPPPLPLIRYQDRVAVIKGFYEGQKGLVIAARDDRVDSGAGGWWYVRRYQVKISKDVMPWCERFQLELLPKKARLKD